MKIYTLTEVTYDYYAFLEFKYASRKISTLETMAKSNTLNPNSFEIIYVGLDDDYREKLSEMAKNAKRIFESKK